MVPKFECLVCQKTLQRRTTCQFSEFSVVAPAQELRKVFVFNNAVQVSNSVLYGNRKHVALSVDSSL
eukprot:m.297855 g.297855  ORF g.297855 m.297855 type:complete len:67 (+) comp16404_c0_seq5:579-779(+)